MDCFGTYFTDRYLDLRRYIRRVATFQATFKGSGPKGRDLPSYFRRVGTFEGTFKGPLRRYLRRVATFQATFEGSGPLKVPSKVPLKVPLKVCTSEGRSPSTFSTSPPWQGKTGSISRFPLNSFFKPDVETKAREVWMQ